MRDCKRSMRRHHRQRMVARATRVLRLWFRRHPEWIPDNAVRLADNLKSCSCWMCRWPPTKPRQKRVIVDEEQ